jgi:hypothetical protein
MFACVVHVTVTGHTITCPERQHGKSRSVLSSVTMFDFFAIHRLVIKKRHSLCSTGSGRPKRPSLGSVLAAIVALAWPVPARVYASVSDGEANCCVKSAEKWPKFRTVRLSLAEPLAHMLTFISGFE